MRNEHPLVSIIVPTRNRAQLLSDCLKSLCSQSYPADRYEIVVVDDGSTDETEAVTGQFQASSHPQVRYIHQLPQCLNVARNTGIAAAKADFIAFVDDDVVVPSGWLSALVDGASRFPSAGALGGPVRERHRGPVPRTCRRREPIIGGFDGGSCDRGMETLPGGNMMIRRDAIEKVGLFDPEIPSWADEIEWLSRLKKTGKSVVYLTDAGVWHGRYATDLRLTKLLKRSFGRGVDSIVPKTKGAHKTSITQELGSMVRCLGHAVLRQCAHGLLEAAWYAGLVYGIFKHRQMIRSDRKR